MDTKKSARFQFVLQIRVYLFKMGRYCQQVYRSLFNCKELHAPLLPRADGKGGVLINRDY